MNGRDITRNMNEDFTSTSHTIIPLHTAKFNAMDILFASSSSSLSNPKPKPIVNLPPKSAYTTLNPSLNLVQQKQPKISVHTKVSSWMQEIHSMYEEWKRNTRTTSTMISHTITPLHTANAMSILFSSPSFSSDPKSKPIVKLPPRSVCTTLNLTLTQQPQTKINVQPKLSSWMQEIHSMHEEWKASSKTRIHPPSPTPSTSPGSISSLKSDPVLGYKLKILVHDLLNYEINKPSQHRLDTATDPLYLSPYFTNSEAETVRNAVVQANPAPAQESETAPPKSVIPTYQTVEQAIQSRLEGFLEKRRASGDARPCGPHTLAPVYMEVLGVTKDEIRDEQFLVRLRREGVPKARQDQDARQEGASGDKKGSGKGKGKGKAGEKMAKKGGKGGKKK